MTDPETLFFIAKIQASLWTVADAACVIFVLLILRTIRRTMGYSTSMRYRWTLLALSILVYPAVITAPDRRMFLQYEIITVSLHFMALLLCFGDLRIVLSFKKQLEEKLRGNSTLTD